ncbi:MAG: outer membrane lipoprotein carrier protein LolA [Campylobacter sp.]|nr:outer membrane lipoprotein carrier protein LolA [Campylobacter sp.]
MKKILCFLAFFGFAFGLEISELAHLKVSEFDGKFEQSKNIKNFSKPIKSEGNFTFKNKELFWNTQKPVVNSVKISSEGTFALIDGKWIKSQKDYDKNLFLNIINFDTDALKKDFDIEVGGEKNDWEMLLKPKNIWLKKIFESIKIAGGKKPKSIKMLEINGDTSEILFYE